MAFTTLALLLAAGGAGLSAYGQVKAGKAATRAGQAQRSAAESQGELADYNAAVAETQAKDAVARGQLEEQRFRGQVRGTIGAQRAGAAADNIDVGFGSAVDVQADAAYLGELDALTIRSNAAREAWGYKVEATDLRKRGQIARKEGIYLEKAGRAQATSAYLGAAGTIVGTGGSLLAAKYGFGTRK